MSAESIARWNAIPLARPDESDDGPNSLKRSRQDEDDGDEESEDNVSLVSRSPSPKPRDPSAMDIDKYDEYVKGAEREVITVNTKIKSDNKGFAMLAKLGWVEGQPLGLSGDGRVEPVPFYVKNDLTGLGKTNQDVRMIESTVSQRRELDSERQIKETEEQRRLREDSVAKRAALQSEISSTLRSFYCQLCDKQFQNVAQYDEHTNSYAHHHKARFRDMQAAQRATFTSQEELDKRKEKERKREEKELRKIAKAAGVKVKPPAPMLVVPQPSGTPPPGESEPKPSGFRKSGWATVGTSPSASAELPASSSTGRSGWANVGPASASPPPSASGSGWTSVANQPESAAPPSASSTGSVRSLHTQSGPAPAFRTGGWTSLDTGSNQPLPPPPSAPTFAPAPPQVSAPPPPPPDAAAPAPVPAKSPAPSRGGWTPTSVENPPRGWQASNSRWPPSQHPPPQETPPASFSQAGIAIAQPAPAPKSIPKAKQQEVSRSGWQQFKAGGPGRRK